MEKGWTRRRLTGAKYACLIASLGMVTTAACTFDPDTNTAGGGGAAIDASDGMSPRDDAISPADCPNDIDLVLRVNGEVQPPGGPQPVVRAVLGDTIEFSAVGTCTQAGPINYEWTFPNGTPTSILATATALDTETIQVYPVEPGDYTVQLRIDDGSPTNFKMRGLLAFTAVGFEDLDHLSAEADVSDLHAGEKSLWIATKTGAYVASLDDPTVGPADGNYQLVTEAFDVDSLDGDMNTVFESPVGVYAWFGAEAGDQTVYRLALDGTRSPLNAITTFENAKNRDISGSATEIRVATSKGSALATSADNFGTFTKEIGGELKAVSVGPTGSFAGAMDLYSLPSATSTDVFAGGDDKIRGLTDDGTHLWVGSDGLGVVKLLGTSVVASYTSGDSGLQSAKVRAMTTDASGDIWAATELGVHRFKKDREIWVQLATAPLGVANNIRAVAIDEVDADAAMGITSRRAIYIGSNDGLAVMRIVP
jgi:hypothetical protein